jgi:hypothetical protein
MTEWQPIETAPKDGTLIIVPGGLAYWRNDEGWHTVTGEDWPGKPIRWEVTHWMPLPEPPWGPPSHEPSQMGTEAIRAQSYAEAKHD